jgi:hypothetical protein
MHKNIATNDASRGTNLDKVNWVFLGSNVNMHRWLMMLQELQTLETFNGVLLGSNITHTEVVNDVPRATNPREVQLGTPRLKCKHTYVTIDAQRVANPREAQWGTLKLKCKHT